MLNKYAETGPIKRPVFFTIAFVLWLSLLIVQNIYLNTDPGTIIFISAASTVIPAYLLFSMLRLYKAARNKSIFLSEKQKELLSEISELKKTEKKALWSEQFLKTMANSSPRGIIAFNVETDRVLYVNSRFFRIWKTEEYEEKAACGEISVYELMDICLKQVKDADDYLKKIKASMDISCSDSLWTDIEFEDKRIIRQHSSQIRNESNEYLGQLITYEDITELHRYEQRLTSSYSNEYLVHRISSRFINVRTENLDEVFSSSLNIIGEYLKMDRGYFSLFSDDLLAAGNLYEWRSESVDENLSRIVNIETAHWPSFKRKLENFEKIVICDVEGMPPEMEAEKERLLIRGVRSVVINPIISGGRLIGFLGFDSFHPVAFSDEASSMLNIVSDIFANAYIRRKEHEALLSSEERFRLLVQHSADMITVIDGEGKIKYVSQAAWDILGFKPDERMGRLIYEAIHPEDVSSVRNTVQAASSRSSVSDTQYIRVRHTDGSWVYLESIFTGQLNNPSINGIIINSRNFTQHRLMQEALRNARNFLNAVINNAGDPMFVKDSGHKWVIVNDAFCRLTGYRREELLGRTDYELFSKEEAEKFYYKDEQVLNKGSVENFELSFTDADNRHHLVVSHESVYEEWTGEKYIIANLRDETKRKELEREISNALQREKELNEMKSRFISMVSHEYRTPLTAILSSAEIIELFGSDMTGKEKQEHLDKIKRSVDYLISLLNDVLLINRVEAGQMEFNPSSFELYGFCREVVNNLIDGSRCRVEINAGFDRLMVNMDKKLLGYILVNLLSNAVKYSRAGSIVWFSIKEDRNNIDFEIRDEGTGISQEDQKRLFEPFFRADNTAHIQGSGLGLPIVKNCVDIHKGTLCFESIPGRGTAFTVSLPAK